MASGPSNLYVVPALTNISVATVQEETNFVSMQMFPICPVPVQSAKYWTFPADALLRTEVEKRAPSDESAGTTFEYKLDGPYYCDRYSLHIDLDRLQMKNADGGLDVDRDTTVMLTRKMLLSKEVNWVAKFMALGVWGTELTVQNGPWNTPGSTPIDDCEKALEAVKLKTGIRPNAASFPYPSWLALKHHAQVKGYIAFGNTQQPSIATIDLIKAILQLDEIYVTQAVANTAPQLTTPNIQYVNKDKVLFAYRTPNPSVMSPTAGYTFAWSGLDGADGNAQRIKKFYIEERDADRVEIDACYDQKIVAPDMGALLTGVVA